MDEAVVPNKDMAGEVYASAQRVSETFADLGRALNLFVEAVKPLDVAVRSWPVYLSEYRDVMCGMESCPCDCESSIIFTPWAGFREEWPQWNALDLLGAIEEHIEWAKQKREEDQDGD